MARRRVLRFQPRSLGGRVRPREPRQFTHNGNVCWRLLDDTGRVLACEIQGPPGAANGWQVVLWLEDEPQFTRPCAGPDEAEFVAQALMEDQLLGGAQVLGALRAMS